MTSEVPYSSLLRLIRKVASPRASEAPGDGDLLERFIAGQDESAFAALVRRHGPMVFSVCRNVLGNADDAEDAFQATFVVLVRKARSISKRESLGSWLHGVAYRVALKARAALARRRTVERQAIPMANSEADTEALWRDLRPVLHEEVERLPARYRDPFVLCYLEGKTNEEAAAILGWPKGTVLSSLARARERLRERLTRRGLTLSAAALAAVLTEKAAPAAITPALLDAAVKSGMLCATGAGASIAAPVLTYADAVSLAMSRSWFLAKLKLAVAGLLACGMLGVGTTMLAISSRQTTPPADSSPQPPAKPDNPAEVLAQPPRVEIPDRERLPGTWVVVGSEQNGKPLAPLKASRLKLTRDSFEMDAPRSELRWIFRRGLTQGAMQVDPDAQPKTMKLVDQQRTLRAIYRFDGDRLILLVADPDVPEPLREFATIPADRRLLLTLQRE